MPSYNEELQALFGVPSHGPLPQTMERVAEVLVKPAFHPECALRVEQGPDGTLLAARTVRRSFWNHWNVRRGGRGSNQVLDRLAPAVAAEEWGLRGSAFEFLRALLDPWPIFGTEAPELGGPGCVVADVWLRDHCGAAGHWCLWAGESMADCGRFVAGVLSLALDRAFAEVLRFNLSVAAHYFPFPPSGA